jgi:hypothetical protein
VPTIPYASTRATETITNTTWQAITTPSTRLHPPAACIGATTGPATRCTERDVPEAELLPTTRWYGAGSAPTSTSWIGHTNPPMTHDRYLGRGVASERGAMILEVLR